MKTFRSILKFSRIREIRIIFNFPSISFASSNMHFSHFSGVAQLFRNQFFTPRKTFDAIIAAVLYLKAASFFIETFRKRRNFGPGAWLKVSQLAKLLTHSDSFRTPNSEKLALTFHIASCVRPISSPETPKGFLLVPHGTNESYLQEGKERARKN